MSTSYFHERTAAKSGAEIGPLSLWLSCSKSASLGDSLLAPTSPIEKVTLWEGLLYLTSGSEIDEGVAKDKTFSPNGKSNLRLRVQSPCSTLSARLSLHPMSTTDHAITPPWAYLSKINQFQRLWMYFGTLQPENWCCERYLHTVVRNQASPCPHWWEM